MQMYNGFSNVQTYLTDLYSEQSGFYNSLRQFLREEPIGEHAEIHSIANTIREHWFELNDETDTEIFLFNHFITECLSEVNWRELAEKVKEGV